ISVASSPRLLSAQTRIDEILDGGIPHVGGMSVPPYEYFDTLRSLCALILKTAQPVDFGSQPRASREAFAGHCHERDEKAAHRLELRTRGESTRRAPRTAS